MENLKTQKHKEINLNNFNDLAYGEKLRTAEAIGEEVGKIFNRALKRANKFLQQYGFQVSVDLKFHYLNHEEKKGDEVNN